MGSRVQRTIRFDLPPLSTKYQVRDLSMEDVGDILALYRSNPLYFHHCPPPPSEQSIRQDLTVVPEGWDRSKKHYLGFFEHSNLMAVLDLIEDFPKEDTAWIGLFMIDGEHSGRGLGSDLLSSILLHLARSGYRRIGLGYVRTNMQAKRFWEKNGFLPQASKKGGIEFEILEKDLEALRFKEDGKDGGKSTDE